MIRPAARLGQLVALALLVAGCRQGPPKVELLVVPPPDLERAEPLVREQIGAQQAAVARAETGGAGTAVLGEAYGELGLVYIAYGFFDAAGLAIENARRLMPQDRRWPHLLGYLAVVQGRLDDGEALFAAALELAPGDPALTLRRGRALLALGRLDEAEPLFAAVAAQDGASAAAVEGLGRVALARGDAHAAISYLERALELQPMAISLHQSLGLAYRRLGDEAAARTHLDQSGDAPVLLVDPVLSRVAELGRSTELMRIRGAETFAQGRYEESAGLYRQVLERDPADFISYKALGFCLDKIGDSEEAMAQLALALERGTTGDAERDRMERAEIYRILGGLAILHGQATRGIAAFRASLELDPERLDPRLKLANALARTGHLAEALAEYDRVLAKAPDLATVLVKRATVLVNLGRREEAVATFRRAVDAAPADVGVRLRFAEALAYLGDQPGATAQRAAAAKLHGEGDAAVVYEEAYRTLQRGELGPALAGFRRTLELDSRYLDAHYQIGAIQGHLGHFDEALAELAMVVEAKPWFAPAWKARVTALLLQERWVEARQDLEQAVRHVPRERGLAHALARLLVTSPDPRARDPLTGLALARRVDAVERSAGSAWTLALAQAAAGTPQEALPVLQRLARDGAAGPDALRRQQLAAVESGTPWLARSPDEILRLLATG